MQRRIGLGVVAVAILVGATATQAQNTTKRYPRVYGATGTPYGPTQAHYQYERRYGRPWHGQGGLRGGVGTGYVNGYPGGFGVTISAGSPAFGVNAPYGFGGPYSNFTFGSFSGFATPGYYQPLGGWYDPTLPAYVGPGYNVPYPAQFPVIQDPSVFIPLDETGLTADELIARERARQRGLLPDVPLGAVDPDWEPDTSPPPVFAPSSAAARAKSLQHQGRGDAALRDLEHLKAYSHYQSAIKAAPDRPEPRFRKAIVLTALGHFDRAVDELKRLVGLGSDWLERPERLTDLYGEENLLAITKMKTRAADWAAEDVRDPDRLLLLGTVLRASGDAAKSRLLLTTAQKLYTVLRDVQSAQVAEEMLQAPVPVAAAAAAPKEAERFPPAVPRDPVPNVPVEPQAPPDLEPGQRDGSDEVIPPLPGE